MKIDKQQIKYWATLCESEENSDDIIAEGLKNKLLSWFGMRSNYEELENFVDMVASGKAKDKDANRLMNKIENDNKFIEMRKTLPKRFDEDDIKTVIIEILNDNMNKDASDQRYKKAVDVLSKLLYRAIISDREEAANDEREYQADKKKRDEKEKKDKEAEYWNKHGTGYAHSGGSDMPQSSSSRWSEPDFRDDEYSKGRLGENEKINEVSDVDVDWDEKEMRHKDYENLHDYVDTEMKLSEWDRKDIISDVLFYLEYINNQDFHEFVSNSELNGIRKLKELVEKHQKWTRGHDITHDILKAKDEN